MMVPQDQSVLGRPVDAPGSPEDGAEATPARRPWIRPELLDFGDVSHITKGISYNPLDGISNFPI